MQFMDGLWGGLLLTCKLAGVSSTLAVIWGYWCIANWWIMMVMLLVSFVFTFF